MTIARLISHWRAEPSVIENVAEWREIPARSACTQEFPTDLHPALAAALVQGGISSLYSHQAAAWDHTRIGRSVAVVAGTASGKTLCYNLPILDRLLHEPKARALYLFPTKALAQDQLANLQQILDRLLDTPPLAAAIYDGDTPTRNRKPIRSGARLVLTNPDMLHLGILPHHTDWAEFFRSLRFVVLDEAHIYRGVFGSHVANVLRRLRRIARFYGAYPHFLITTATLANPGEFAARLIEDPVVVIENDGAPRGPRHFLFYNPPVVDPNLGLRRSAVHESVRLAEDLLAYDIQTIMFGRSRRTVEVLLTYLREKAITPGESLLIKDPHLPGKEGLHTQDSSRQTVRGYRSGYLPAERRSIEQGLRSGQVRLVAATNALELGIDIGGMGAALLVGYPGGIASTWQQAGRAGRGLASSLAVLVATADPIDQFLVAHPDYFFGRPVEHALINPDNLLILLDHLRCAAFELPFSIGEAYGSLDPSQVADFMDFMRQQGLLHASGGKYFWIADAYPAQAISLRSLSAVPISLQVEDEYGAPRTIGIVDRQSALWMVHPQAVYLHEARSFFVDNLDLDQNIAHLQPFSGDYYTVPQNQVSVQLVEQQEQKPQAGCITACGELLVTGQVVGFQKVRWHTHEVLSVEPLLMPPTELTTTGYWLALEDGTIDALREAGLWRNDPNNYGSDWPRRRDMVRARDGYRCQACGRIESEHQHDVHHKLPFRLFASPAQANALDNLVTLCHDCHMRAEAAVRVRSGLAGLAYVLRSLAPFLVMCDAGDLGVHADPQSPVADGRPAVIIYDQAPGGIGLSRRLFEEHNQLMAQSRLRVSDCPCSDGCPSCIGPGGTGLVGRNTDNSFGGKAETLALLEILTR